MAKSDAKQTGKAEIRTPKVEELKDSELDEVNGGFNESKHDFGADSIISKSTKTIKGDLSK